MSTLYVNNIDTESGTDITIPTGKKLVVTDAGSVIAPNQIIQTTQKANAAYHTNTSPGNWADTNYQHTITPVYSTSAIEVIMHIPFRLNSSGSPMRGAFRIYRDISGGSSALVVNTTSNYEQLQVRNATNEHDGIASFHILDLSHATTSQLTYRVQSYIHNDSGAVYITAYDANVGGNIILREIAQ